ncbi:hypothetical protein HZ326_23300 [Fusarium oxysporum f. sp. albedinis]|nr:hypothetical protein HZ326_23300 [Fusarium oxysporum f. sp. albedinis]
MVPSNPSFKSSVTSSAGVGVRSCTSSFETTLSGPKGASPAPLKPPRILLSPLEAQFVICPAIWACCNNPIAREVTFSVPVGKMILACTNDEWRNRLAFYINRLDDCNPFPISRLYWLWSSLSF